MIATVQPKFETGMIIYDNVIDRYISSRLIIKHFFGKKSYSISWLGRAKIFAGQLEK